MFPIQRFLLQSLVRKWRFCVVRIRSTFSRSVMVSVAVSSLGHTDLFFIDQGTKVNGQCYRDVLLHQQLLPAIRDLSGDFFTFQQDNAPAHRARETVQLLTCETPCSLHRSSSVASQQSWPEPSRLPDVGKHRSRMHDVDQLKSHTWSKSGNISTRCSSMKRSGSGVHVFELVFEHTEDILNTDFSYDW